MLEPSDIEQIKKTMLEVTLASEDRIVTRINREITDLAEINQAVLDKLDVLPNHERRLSKVERKLGIA